MEHLIPIALADTQEVTCSNCQYSHKVYFLPNTWPHLYCTRCNNFYHEIYKQRNYNTILTNWGRSKVMNVIESQAPACECGGLFLFSSHPSCPQCRNDLFFTYPHTNNVKRLFQSEVIIFDGSKEYQNTGLVKQYIFQS